MIHNDSTFASMGPDHQDDRRRLIADPIAWAERAIGEGVYCRFTARDLIEILVTLAMTSLVSSDCFLLVGKRFLETGEEDIAGRTRGELAAAEFLSYAEWLLSVLIPGAKPARLFEPLGRLVDEIDPDPGREPGRRRGGDKEGSREHEIAVRMVRFVFEELGGASGTTA